MNNDATRLPQSFTLPPSSTPGSRKRVAIVVIVVVVVVIIIIIIITAATTATCEEIDEYGKYLTAYARKRSG
jgi:heme/copper-type cytochrome/quinol oxidase subunit 2